MKIALGLTLVVAATIGLWVGLNAGLGAAVDIQVGLAVMSGGVFLFSLWLWRRARPGSGDAMIMPVMALLMAGTLINALPKLFWPTAGRLHVAGSILGMIATIAAVIVLIYRRRKLRPGSRPV